MLESCSEDYETISVDGIDNKGNHIRTHKKLKKINQDNIDLALYSKKIKDENSDSDANNNNELMYRLHGGNT